MVYITKYINMQSTTVDVPSPELGLSHPLSRQRVCPSPPPRNQGGGHTRLRVRGWGSPNSDDWKNLALCLLCGLYTLEPLCRCFFRNRHVFPLYVRKKSFFPCPAKELKWQAENVFLFFTVYLVPPKYYSSEYLVHHAI
jgi:hypothetical protein